MAKQAISEITKDEELGAAEIVTGAPKSSLQTVSSAGVSGEVDGTDVRFPKVQIVQGVGPLSERKELSKGMIILDGEHILSEGDTPIEFVVCKIGKQFEENLEYGSDEIPRIVNTKQEVLTLNGTTEGGRVDGKWVPPTWKAIADSLIAIKAGENVSETDRELYYPFEGPDNTYWSFARWIIKGVAYKAAAVEIFTAASMYYREGLIKGTFKLTTQKRMFGPNAVMVPVVNKGQRNSDELSSWLNTLA